jgi:deazaflavin-dependent oxidoreductase (nitroreductase family)
VAVVLSMILELALILVFRFRWRPGIDAIRRFNRRFLNPVMNRFAGGEHWYASAVHHVGRTSGKEYTTPLWVLQVGRFFYAPLAYGEHVDWCRNILAGGDAVVDFHGDRYEVYNPTIITADEAAGILPWRDSARFGVYGVESYLRMETRTEHVIRAS